MKKIFTLLTLAFSIGLFAQNVVIVSVEDTVYYDAGKQFEDAAGHIVVKNTNASALDFKVKRSSPSGSQTQCASNYFCWDQCYLPTADVSTGIVPLAPEVDDHSFSGHITSTGDGIEDCCTITYTFFNSTDANDSVSASITFCASNSISVEEEVKAVNAVYPNPASDVVNVKFNTPQNGSFQIINVVGQVVKSVEILNANQLSVDITELDAGVYFYSLVVKGEPVETKRLVISK